MATALGATALGACAASPSPTITETVKVAVTVTPTATATALAPEDQAFPDWEITPTGIGPMTLNLNYDELGILTGLDYSGDLDTFEGACATFSLGGAGALSSMYALASSQGATGHIDSYTLYASDSYDGGYPTTVDGITIGSSMTDLDKAYGDGLVTEEYLYDPTWTRAYVLDGDYGMLFLVDDTNTVSSITVGRDPQYLYIEGCA